MDPVWVVLLLATGAALFLGALKRTPRDDQRRIPYQPDRSAPAMPPLEERRDNPTREDPAPYWPAAAARPTPGEAPPARPKADIFDLRRATPIRILYTDAQGEESEREVDVKSFTVQGGPHGTPTHLRGQCHMRQASRAFTLRRIEEAFDMRDGSEIPDVASWLLEQPSRRRPRDLDL